MYLTFIICEQGIQIPVFWGADYSLTPGLTVWRCTSVNAWAFGLSKSHDAWMMKVNMLEKFVGFFIARYLSN
jgi:hypothetical protein